MRDWELPLQFTCADNRWSDANSCAIAEANRDIKDPAPFRGFPPSARRWDEWHRVATARHSRSEKQMDKDRKKRKTNTSPTTVSTTSTDHLSDRLPRDVEIIIYRDMLGNWFQLTHLRAVNKAAADLLTTLAKGHWEEYLHQARTKRRSDAGGQHHEMRHTQTREHNICKAWQSGSHLRELWGSLRASTEFMWRGVQIEAEAYLDESNHGATRIKKAPEWPGWIGRHLRLGRNLTSRDGEFLDLGRSCLRFANPATRRALIERILVKAHAQGAGWELITSWSSHLARGIVSRRTRNRRDSGMTLLQEMDHTFYNVQFMADFDLQVQMGEERLLEIGPQEEQADSIYDRLKSE